MLPNRDKIPLVSELGHIKHTAMRVPNTKQPTRRLGARTAKRGKYAIARVRAGLTVRDLTAQGFGTATVSNADNGKLPKNRAIKAAYLKAIGLEASP